LRASTQGSLSRITRRDSPSFLSNKEPGLTQAATPRILSNDSPSFAQMNRWTSTASDQWRIIARDSYFPLPANTTHTKFVPTAISAEPVSVSRLLAPTSIADLPRYFTVNETLRRKKTLRDLLRDLPLRPEQNTVECSKGGDY
jgi:hypothetical protein